MIQRHMSKIGVVGLGYVGLPLALLAEERKFGVIGIDNDKKKLAKLKQHKTVIDDIAVNERLVKSKVRFTDDYSYLSDRDIVIICVPTPINENKLPDISLVKNAVINSVKQMKPGSLLIIESTINPGVCDEIIVPAIHQNSDHKVGESIYLAHCPERINPGDLKWTVDNIDRVVGAESKEGLRLAADFYKILIKANVKKMDNLKETEAVKIVENTFRDVNIAFVNELAMSFKQLGININNVIDGAATKPFAFLPHYPGIGIGGHCIPVDPYYLIEYAKGNGFDHEFLSLARSINESMPLYVIGLLEERLKELVQKELSEAKIAILGLSYKPNIGDDRESPAYKVIDILRSKGAQITSFDPYVQHDETSSSSLAEALYHADAAILVTAHKEFTSLDIKDFENLTILVDGRNALIDKKISLRKAGVSYVGIGT